MSSMQMPWLLTMQMSWLLTMQMSWLQTQQMSWLQTSHHAPAPSGRFWGTKSRLFRQESSFRPENTAGGRPGREHHTCLPGIVVFAGKKPPEAAWGWSLLIVCSQDICCVCSQDICIVSSQDICIEDICILSHLNATNHNILAAAHVVVFIIEMREDADVFNADVLAAECLGCR